MTRGPNETIIDYTVHCDPPVTTDGAMTGAQLASLGSHRGGDLITSDRPASTKRTKTRNRRLDGTPNALPRRADDDDRTEIQVLHSQVEGLIEKVAHLEAGMQHLSQEWYDAKQHGWVTTQ